MCIRSELAAPSNMSRAYSTVAHHMDIFADDEPGADPCLLLVKVVI